LEIKSYSTNIAFDLKIDRKFYYNEYKVRFMEYMVSLNGTKREQDESSSRQDFHHEEKAAAYSVLLVRSIGFHRNRPKSQCRPPS
jgi:hypothetical protein